MRMMVKLRLPLLLILVVLAGACQPKVQETAFEPKAKWGQWKPIDDLRVLPQDAGAFASKGKQNALLVSAADAKAGAQVYIDRLFAPWRGCNPAAAQKSHQFVHIGSKRNTVKPLFLILKNISCFSKL